ncbi:MAG: methylmalonyl Co-A mutase-associated GTPase MeaB [Alphaproteobacteria bacterium]|jgi:LAO/AO transport system kinase|nr:methylmalonyl Co-A mutase-associated GTPase MeaB [Alphaproteobacteria bacterium]MDP6566071.1 methylmalonyl Co-A mutase-associated GTPase MeaB [Alphaproteobacteria bacterium]MDP6812897.1 methylmalonyl Co-A mutase-associated GTPase MeaB [Alphaproteobacteria bacterium]
MTKGGDQGRLAKAVVGGDRRALARAITLVESTRADHRRQAEALLSSLGPGRDEAIRLGITGAPGVGKSSFIETFGQHLTGQGHKLAVLAVDPSSSRTGGSILGDKTRMPDLSRDANAFIRPSPAGASLGGVARRTRDVIRLVEAAGHDVVIVETVGVGQSEYAVADMVDVFLLLVAPGGGDELQGIKRGIMELADLLLVNKADGGLLKAARHAAADYASALSLIRPKASGWRPEVLLVSALRREGLAEAWAAVGRFRAAIEQAGGLALHRAGQARRWLWEEVEENLLAALKSDPAIAALAAEMERRAAAGEITPSAAAAAILEAFLKRG